MRRIVLVLVMVCAAAYMASACVTCGCASKKGKAHTHTHDAKTITTVELQQIVASEKDVTILDARQGQWDDGRRVPGAKALSPKATAEQAAAAIPSKDAKVVTYCTNLQCPASKLLAERLRKLGYKNVNEYPNGIEGWVKAGNKIDSTK